VFEFLDQGFRQGVRYSKKRQVAQRHFGKRRSVGAAADYQKQLLGAEEFPIHAQGRSFRVNADRP